MTDAPTAGRTADDATPQAVPDAGTVEWGVRFLVPHRNAGEAVCLPDVRTAARLVLYTPGLAELVQRPVGPWTSALPSSRPVVNGPAPAPAMVAVNAPEASAGAGAEGATCGRCGTPVRRVNGIRSRYWVHDDTGEVGSDEPQPHSANDHVVPAVGGPDA